MRELREWVVAVLVVLVWAGVAAQADAQLRGRDRAPVAVRPA